MLLGTILPEHVYHVLGLDCHELGVERVRPSWMPFQHLVGLRVAKLVERDAVYAVRIDCQFVIRNPVGFDELHVERHVRFEHRVPGEENERLSVLAPRHPYCAQLQGEVRLLRPHLEVMLYLPVRLLVFEEHLESWPRSYRVFRKRLHDAASV